MRLTSFTDFALRALMRLAGEPGRSFATNEIAAEFGISRNHLAKVVRDLADSGFIRPSAASAAASRWPARPVHHDWRSGARAGRAAAGRMFSRGWRQLRADAALPAEEQSSRPRAKPSCASSTPPRLRNAPIPRNGQTNPAPA